MIRCARRVVWQGSRCFSVVPVRELGDPVLRIPAVEVTEFGPELQSLVCDLIDTMRANNGAGIAAPQIGVSQRVFVVEGKGDNPRYPYKPVIPLTVFVNPTVEVLVKGAKMKLIEGCLSIPGFRGRVERHPRVLVRAQRVDGTPFAVRCCGHAAGTMQHEQDHLDSKLFPDLAGSEGLMTSRAFDKYYGGAEFLSAMEAINKEHPIPCEFLGDMVNE